MSVLDSNLGSKIRKLFSKIILGGSLSSFREQLFGTALDNNFGDRLWGIILWSSFGKKEQLSTATSNRNFEQIGFREQLWGLALEQFFLGAAFGSNFTEQLSGAALKNNFGNLDLLWGADLKYAILVQPLCDGLANIQKRFLFFSRFSKCKK